MIERQTDARRINGFLNDPSVYPYVRGSQQGPFDMAAVIRNPNHVVLCGEHGGVIFFKHMEGYYEAHTAVLPEGRGKWTLKLGRAVLQWMFFHTDAMEIATKCPHGNVAATAGARVIGARHEWTTRPIWPVGGVVVPVDVYVISIQEWAAQNLKAMEPMGRAFHDWIGIHGVKTDHADDPTHDAYVGIATEMIDAGQVVKGVGFYNRWAVMSDYRPILITSRNPMTLDIGVASLVLGADGWRAEPCRLAA